MRASLITAGLTVDVATVRRKLTALRRAYRALQLAHERTLALLARRETR